MQLPLDLSPSLAEDDSKREPPCRNTIDQHRWADKESTMGIPPQGAKNHACLKFLAGKWHQMHLKSNFSAFGGIVPNPFKLNPSPMYERSFSPKNTP